MTAMYIRSNDNNAPHGTAPINGHDTDRLRSGVGLAMEREIEIQEASAQSTCPPEARKKNLGIPQKSLAAFRFHAVLSVVMRKYCLILNLKARSKAKDG